MEIFINVVDANLPWQWQWRRHHNDNALVDTRRSVWYLLEVLLFLHNCGPWLLFCILTANREHRGFMNGMGFSNWMLAPMLSYNSHSLSLYIYYIHIYVYIYIYFQHIYRNIVLCICRKYIIDLPMAATAVLYGRSQIYPFGASLDFFFFCRKLCCLQKNCKALVPVTTNFPLILTCTKQTKWTVLLIYLCRHSSVKWWCRTVDGLMCCCHGHLNVRESVPRFLVTSATMLVAVAMVVWYCFAVLRPSFDKLAQYPCCHR